VTRVAPLVTHAESGTITPFWQRIPRFFLFPFHVEPLLYMTFLALTSLLDLIVPHILGWSIVQIGIALAVLRYAFRVVEQTSLGFLTPKEYELEATLDTVYLPYKMFGILLLWGIVESVALAISPLLGFLVLLFTTLALPAVAMVLVTTGSFVQGINPAQWVSIMRAVGMPYLALWFFLFLLLGGAGTALRLLWPLLGGWLTLPLVTFANIYFTLVMANMMGYVLYQYHGSLGLAVKVGFDASKAGGAKGTRVAADPIGDDIAQHIAGGDLKGAMAIAKEQQQDEPDNVVAHERYHKLLQVADSKETLLRHGPSYIAALMRKDQSYRALDVLTSLRNLQPDFELVIGAHTLPLAREARRRGEHDYALTLMRGFDDRHPRHPDIPAVYLLSAQILSEHFRNDEMARTLLRQLISRYPDSPGEAEARIYLQTMDRIAALNASIEARHTPDST
jgi:hypothetical protein